MFAIYITAHWEPDESALIIGYSIVRNVKIETPATIVNCLPETRVPDILANLKVLANAKRKFIKIVIHVGANDVWLRQSLSTKVLFVNDMIIDHKLNALSLTETWLKPYEYIILNESTPQDYCYKKGKGGGVATIYSNILSISQKTCFKYNSFEVMVLQITLSREKIINDKSLVMFLLATVYRPPGHHTNFIKEFGNILSELVVSNLPD